ncbi:MAG: GNAT family N-acetyltransferase [candidate division WOR-3 bacterium]
MGRDAVIEIVNLTEKNLIDAPEWQSHPYSCKFCLYWEFPEECTDPLSEVKEERLERKRLWVRWVRREFGDCGKLIYVDYKAVGFAEFAPARFLPNAVRYQSGPPSDDAVLISCLFIPEKIYQHQGLGSLMVKSIISEARARNIKALETFARKGRADSPSGPVEFWQKHGFAILRDIDEFPLLRLQL